MLSAYDDDDLETINVHKLGWRFKEELKREGRVVKVDQGVNKGVHVKGLRKVKSSKSKKKKKKKKKIVPQIF